MGPQRRSAATFLLFGALIGGLAAGLPSVFASRDPAQADAECAAAVSRAASHAAARALAAVVTVDASGGAAREGSLGSGVLVCGGRFVLTAYHVVAGAERLTATFPDGSEKTLGFHAADESLDLALLSVPGASRGGEEGLYWARNDPKPGETVLAVGSPFGLSGSVSKGVISAVGRRSVVSDNAAPLLQTDAALNPGSSGGPLVNLHGEAVGLVVAILTEAGDGQGVGFALPASEVRRALPRLVEKRPCERPWIGLRVQTRPAPGASGLEILAVTPGGPGERAGLRPGDLLLSFGETPAGSSAAVRVALSKTCPGEKVSVNVRRGDREFAAVLSVGTWADARPGRQAKPAKGKKS